MPVALKKSSYWRIRVARDWSDSPLGAMHQMETSVLSTEIGSRRRIWVENWSMM